MSEFEVGIASIHYYLESDGQKLDPCNPDDAEKIVHILASPHALYRKLEGSHGRRSLVSALLGIISALRPEQQTEILSAPSVMGGLHRYVGIVALRELHLFKEFPTADKLKIALNADGFVGALIPYTTEIMDFIRRPEEEERLASDYFTERLSEGNDRWAKELVEIIQERNPSLRARALAAKGAVGGLSVGGQASKVMAMIEKFEPAELDVLPADVFETLADYGQATTIKQLFAAPPAATADIEHPGGRASVGDPRGEGSKNKSPSAEI